MQEPVNLRRWTRNVLVRVFAGLAVGVAILTLVYLGWSFQWEREAKRDRAVFDVLLASGDIDRVRLITYDFARDLEETNIVVGSEAKRFMSGFVATNRTPKPDVSKAQAARHVTVMNGTNVLGWITQFDNGLWRFGKYSFITRTPP